VRAEVSWIVEQHGLFQNYYYVHHLGGNRHGRDRFKGHQWYAACAAFCERWDQPSFDPDYPVRPLETFEPLVRQILGRPAHDPRYLSGPMA
jgi:predicted HD phosphohydrolase